GVGPKTATELLRQFGSLDALQDRLSEVKSDRLRANLTGAREVLRRNQRLIRLRHEQPPTGLEDLVPRPPAIERLRELFGQWGFRGLLAQLPGEAPAANGSHPQQGVLL